MLSSLTPSSSRPGQTRTDPGGVGGELVISIVPASSIPGGKPYRTATDRVRMQLQGMAKLKGRVPSDEVEELAFHVQWIPRQATGGAALSTKDTGSEGLAVVCLGPLLASHSLTSSTVRIPITLI